MVRKYCKYCGKEFLGDGMFCSGSCSVRNSFRKELKLSDKDNKIVSELSVTNVNTNNTNYTVLGFGNIIKLSRQIYLDQLDKGIKIHSSYLSDYLLGKYNISENQYFNIVVYGDINYKRYCKNCNKELPFLGINKNLSRSYRNYCSSKCEAEYRISTNTYHFQSCNRYSIPSMIDHDIRASIKEKDKLSKGIHEFQDINNIILMSKNQFITNFKTKRGYSKAKLYWSLLGEDKYNDYFKIGITTSSLWSRAGHVRGDSKPYKSIHLIYEGNIDFVADLEYKIKMKFKDYRLGSSTEIFPSSIFRDVLLYIKELLIQ